MTINQPRITAPRLLLARAMTHSISVVLLVAAALATAACDESLSSIAGPTPNLEPTFSSIQREIFESSDSSGREACVSCHNTVGAQFTGGLNLNHDFAYDQLVSRASTQKPSLLRVAPGNANSSYMIHKLEGTPDILQLRMPRNGPPFLTSGQVTIIRRWIDLGAQRD
jgi:hypothetical protein